VSKHPNNGPTFSKVPPKKRKPRTDEERALHVARKEVSISETQRLAAKERRSHELLRSDVGGFLREFGVVKK
jgi:hypothetical protein